MRTATFLVLAGCAVAAAAPQPPSAAPAAPAGLAYPAAPKGDVVDDYFGTKVADPYRWLEDPDSTQTRAWIDGEQKLTRGWLDAAPGRDAMHDRLTKLWNFERYGVPMKKGGHYFFSRNDGLQNQSVLYEADKLDATPKVLIDPNGFSADGTVALNGLSFSEDGKYLAYGTADAGSDWVTWKVRDLTTGKDPSDQISWTKSSDAAWKLDDSGFYYSRYPKPAPSENALQAVDHDETLYWHKLGTSQDQDQVVYSIPDHPDWSPSAGITEDGRYLVIDVWKDTDPKNQLHVEDLKASKPTLVPLFTSFDALYDVVGNDGTTFYVRTDLDAPRGRVVAFDLAHPDKAHWRDVVPQGPDSMQAVSYVGGKLVVSYLHDAHSLVKTFGTDGRAGPDVPLQIGTAGGFGGRADDPETFYSFASFTTPSTIYRYDVKTNTSTIFKQPKVDFDPTQYVTEQVFYASKDGTKVPMFVSHKKGIPIDGTAPTLLYGYGGFDISITPWFSIPNLVWMQMGGIYAVANIRGGGEYGREWHEAAVKDHRQVAFDDFIAAAQYLITNKYTSTPKLAINGASNGGCLIGSVLTQRPDLFGAALPEVGVLDLLRYQKFTIGYAWSGDYGTSDTADGFKYLYAYSPYHNVKPGTVYPPTMIMTSDHDDRVVPGHSFKFAAAMQAAQAGPAPILIRIESRAGHGAGTPITKLIDVQTDRFAFLTRSLNVDPVKALQ